MPEILPKNKVLIRKSAGTASFDEDGTDHNAELFISIHGSPIVEFDDGTTVYWTWEELLEEAWGITKEKPTDGNQ